MSTRGVAGRRDRGIGLYGIGIATGSAEQPAMELEGTLMEHDHPIVDFKCAGGNLVYKKEYPENAKFYLDM